MRFLADECIWRVVVDCLRHVGLEGDWIHDLSPSLLDREILELSLAESCLIITEDADFGELIFRGRLKAYGVVRVRLSAFPGTKEETASNVARRISNLGNSLVGQFTTIEPNRTRQRGLPIKVD